MNYRVLLAMALGHLVIDMHPGGLPVVLPRIRAEYGLPYAAIGLLVLTSQISSSVLQPLFGIVSDRMSTRWLLPVSFVAASGGYVLLLLQKTLPGTVLGIFLMGLGVAAFHPEASKLAHYASGTRKAWSMSVFAIGGNVGVAFGSFLMGALLLRFGLPGVAGFLVFTVPMALFFAKSTSQHYEVGPRPSAPLGAADNRETPSDAEATKTAQTNASIEEITKKGTGKVGALILLSALVMLRSFAYTSMTTFIPLYYESHLGLGTKIASTMLTTFQAAGALGTIIGGWVADFWGRRTVIIASMLLSTPFLYLFPRVDGPWTYVVVVLAAALLFGTFGVTTVLGQELLPHRVGLASGLMLGFSVGTGGIGATALGYVADVWGLEQAFVAVTVLPVIAAVAARFLPADSRSAGSGRLGVGLS